MTIIIEKKHLDKIKKHVEKLFPEEACGILIGIPGNPAIVKDVIPTKNAFNGDKTKNYEIDPLDLAKADKKAEQKNWEIIGVFHSHPNCPGKPSKTDTKKAWPEISYFIISVKNGLSAEYTSSRYNPNKKEFEKEEIILKS